MTSAVWTLTVIQGVDANPNSHLNGAPTLVTPAGTTRQTATQQRIEGLLPDVTYTARVVVVTSLNETVSLWSHIQGEPVE